MLVPIEGVSETPRTDALYAGMPMPPALSPATREALDLARKLERELAEAEREVAELRGLLARAMDEMQGGDYDETGPTLRDLIYEKLRSQGRAHELREPK